MEKQNIYISLPCPLQGHFFEGGGIFVKMVPTGEGPRLYVAESEVTRAVSVSLRELFVQQIFAGRGEVLGRIWRSVQLNIH